MQDGLLIDIKGLTLTAEEQAILAHPYIGGVLLFTRNYETRHQLMDLIASIVAISPTLFIAVDQEGGVIQRFQREGFTTLPPAAVYGEVYSLHKETGITLATHYGYTMAAELIACGVDLSLAPVLDIDGENVVIGGLNRAFHATPEGVSVLASAFITGMAKAGMPSVGKHFPGHGSCSLDSHLTQPIDTSTLEKLQSWDLMPFKNLIQDNLLDGIMTAHVTYPAIDKEMPAGFSKKWLTTILREELNFQGLIMSDCLSMAGADIGTLDVRAEKAINAGCDMLIVCNQSPETLWPLLNKTWQTSSTSHARILSFKQKMQRFI